MAWNSLNTRSSIKGCYESNVLVFKGGDFTFSETRTAPTATGNIALVQSALHPVGSFGLTTTPVPGGNVGEIIAEKILPVNYKVEFNKICTISSQRTPGGFGIGTVPDWALGTPAATFEVFENDFARPNSPVISLSPIINLSTFPADWVDGNNVQYSTNTQSNKGNGTRVITVQLVIPTPEKLDQATGSLVCVQVPISRV